MRTYETVVVIDAHQPDETIEKIIERVKKIVADNKGNMIEVSRWGKRRLTYKIKNKQHGYYMYFLYESEKREIPSILEHNFKITEEILRYLTLKLDDKALAYRLKKKKMEVEKVENLESNEKGKLVEETKLL